MLILKPRAIDQSTVEVQEVSGGKPSIQLLLLSRGSNRELWILHTWDQELMILSNRWDMELKDSSRWGRSMNLNQIKIHQLAGITLMLRLNLQNHTFRMLSF